MRAPAPLRIGAKVFARDHKGFWYAAKVIDERSEPEKRFRVTFSGFPSNHDEWVPKARIRDDLTKPQILQRNAAAAYSGNTTGFDAEENTWIVDKIIAKRQLHRRGVKYLVRWEGFGPEGDTWEPKVELPKAEIASYERSRAKAAAKPKQSPKTAAPRGPYVRAATEGTDAAARREHAPVDEWRKEIGYQAALALPKVKKAGKQQVARLLCPAWVFVDLHAALREMAASLDLPVGVEQLVTPIEAEKGAGGGKHIADSFYVASYDVINALVEPFNEHEAGTGALLLKENDNAAMLLAPLKFTFKTVRNSTRARQELIVTGEMGVLVFRTPSWDFVKPPEDEDEDAKAEREVREHNHKRAIAAAVQKLGTAAPEGMLQWLQPLL